MNRRLIALDVVRPLGGYTIQLKLGIGQCDMRVETGGRSVVNVAHELAGYFQAGKAHGSHK